MGAVAYHRFYLLGASTLVRIAYNGQDLKIGAESFDPASGKFVIDNAMLSRIESSPDAEEIDRSRFEAMREKLRAF